jgi:hypothetical protein
MSVHPPVPAFADIAHDTIHDDCINVAADRRLLPDGAVSSSSRRAFTFSEIAASTFSLRARAAAGHDPPRSAMDLPDSDILPQPARAGRRGVLLWRHGVRHTVATCTHRLATSNIPRCRRLAWIPAPCDHLSERSVSPMWVEMDADLLNLAQLRNNAAECIRLAEAARASEHTFLFIELAERWRTLACPQIVKAPQR